MRYDFHHTIINNNSDLLFLKKIQERLDKYSQYLPVYALNIEISDMLSKEKKDEINKDLDNNIFLGVLNFIESIDNNTFKMYVYLLCNLYYLVHDVYKILNEKKYDGIYFNHFDYNYYIDSKKKLFCIGNFYKEINMKEDKDIYSYSNKINYRENLYSISVSNRLELENTYNIYGAVSNNYEKINAEIISDNDKDNDNISNLYSKSYEYILLRDDTDAYNVYEEYLGKIKNKYHPTETYELYGNCLFVKNSTAMEKEANINNNEMNIIDFLKINYMNNDIKNISHDEFIKELLNCDTYNKNDALYNKIINKVGYIDIVMETYKKSTKLKKFDLKIEKMLNIDDVEEVMDRYKKGNFLENMVYAYILSKLKNVNLCANTINENDYHIIKSKNINESLTTIEKIVIDKSNNIKYTSKDNLDIFIYEKNSELSKNTDDIMFSYESKKVSFSYNIQTKNGKTMREYEKNSKFMKIQNALVDYPSIIPLFINNWSYFTEKYDFYYDNKNKKFIGFDISKYHNTYDFNNCDIYCEISDNIYIHDKNTNEKYYAFNLQGELFSTQNGKLAQKFYNILLQSINDDDILFIEKNDEFNIEIISQNINFKIYDNKIIMNEYTVLLENENYKFINHCYNSFILETKEKAKHILILKPEIGYAEKRLLSIVKNNFKKIKIEHGKGKEIMIKDIYDLIYNLKYSIIKIHYSENFISFNDEKDILLYMITCMLYKNESAVFKYVNTIININYNTDIYNYLSDSPYSKLFKDVFIDGSTKLFTYKYWNDYNDFYKKAMYNEPKLSNEDNREVFSTNINQYKAIDFNYKKLKENSNFIIILLEHTINLLNTLMVKNFNKNVKSDLDLQKPNTSFVSDIITINLSNYSLYYKIITNLNITNNTNSFINDLYKKTTIIKYDIDKNIKYGNNDNNHNQNISIYDIYSILIDKNSTYIISYMLKEIKKIRKHENKIYSDITNNIELFFIFCFGSFIYEFQTNIINHMLNEKSSSYFYQLLMGKGKSAVISPLLVLYLMANDKFKDKSIFYTVPKHLIGQSYETFFKCIGNYILRKIKVLDISRGNRGIKLFDDNQCIYIIDDGSVKSIILNEISINPNKRINRIQNPMIFDEVDELFDPLSSELNYPTEKIVHIEDNDINNRFTIIKYIYDKLYVNFVKQKIDETKYGKFPHFYVKSEYDKNDFIKIFNDIEHSELSKLKKYFIDNVVPAVSKMIMYKDFGLVENYPEQYNNQNNNYKIQAIPFKSVDVPAFGSKFTDINIRCMLTYIFLRSNGLRLYDKKLYCKYLKKKYEENKLFKKKEIYEKIYNSLFENENHIEIIFVDDKIVNNFKKNDFRLCIREKDIIDDYIYNIIYTGDKSIFTYEEEQYNISGIALSVFFKNTFGFTGTPNLFCLKKINDLYTYICDNNSFIYDNDYEYNSHIKKETPMKTNDIIKESIIKKNKNNIKIANDEKNIKMIKSSKLDCNDETLNELDILQYNVLNEIKNNHYNCLIDSGAYFLNRSVLETVNLLSLHLNKDKYDEIIFIDEKGEKNKYDIESKTIIHYTKPKNYNKKAFVYFDNSHIVGQDILIPANGKGIITVRSNTILRVISQAIYRLRNINGDYDYDEKYKVKDDSQSVLFVLNFTCNNVETLYEILKKNDEKLNKVKYSKFIVQYILTLIRYYDNKLWLLKGNIDFNDKYKNKNDYLYDLISNYDKSTLEKIKELVNDYKDDYEKIKNLESYHDTDTSEYLEHDINLQTNINIENNINTNLEDSVQMLIKKKITHVLLM